MKNKRILTMLFVLVLSALVPIMAENMQKTYTVRDEVYVRIDNLARRAGVLGPSSFSPMSGRALQIALDRIDPSTLSQEDRLEYACHPMV